MKRFSSYRVDNHTHTHTPSDLDSHKQTLLKTIPPSLRSALTFDGKYTELQQKRHTPRCIGMQQFVNSLLT